MQTNSWPPKSQLDNPGHNQRDSTTQTNDTIFSDLPSVSGLQSAVNASTVATYFGHPTLDPGLHNPIYYLDIASNEIIIGRVLMQVRRDVVPQMAMNFHKLIVHERGFGFKGCVLFHALGYESIITGDFEFQNGQGGYSALEQRFFIPDENVMPTKRGALRMRCVQGWHTKSVVGSQFQIMLSDGGISTAVFGFIVDGFDVLDTISLAGDSTGRPQLKTTIKNCGEY